MHSIAIFFIQASSFFREGPLVTRHCMGNGEWERVDFTSCTLVESSQPFLLLSLVIEVDEVEEELEIFLVLEVCTNVFYIVLIIRNL